MSERDLPAASGASILAAVVRCAAAYVCMVEQRAVGRLAFTRVRLLWSTPWQRGVALKIAYARGPHFMGRYVSPAKALVANTIASQRGTPYDNHGGAAGRRGSPGPSARVGGGRDPLKRAFNTMAGSVGDARAELADSGTDHHLGRRDQAHRAGRSQSTARRARAPLCEYSSRSCPSVAGLPPPVVESSGRNCRDPTVRSPLRVGQQVDQGGL